VEQIMTPDNDNLNPGNLGKRGFVSRLFFMLAAVCILSATSAHAEKRLITLTVTDGEIDFSGKKYMIYKYNDSFPGPEIKVTEGDLVRVRLVNNSSGNHGMFFHGVGVTPQVSMEEQEIVVKPGFEFTYSEFEAKPAGTHLYHCSFSMGAHLHRGMYGAFIVEEKPNKSKSKIKARYKFDKEFAYIFSDWNPSADTMHETHGVGHPSALLDNEASTINDRVIDGSNPVQIEAKQGERIRLRLGNLGMLPHKVRLSEGFLVTHDDGYRISDPQEQTSIILYAGKSSDVIVKALKPGKLTLYHSINLPEATIASLTGRKPAWQLEMEKGEHDDRADHGAHDADHADHADQSAHSHSDAAQQPIEEKLLHLQREFPAIVIDVSGKGK